jgi:hypothetical protein
MTFEEARELSLKKAWSTKACGQEKCWCLMIVCDPITYETADGNTDVYDYIVSSGSIDAATATYISNLHNINLIS